VGEAGSVTLAERLGAVFEQLSRTEARWCMLRLPHGTGKSGGDIDLLVDRGDLPAVCDVLVSNGFLAVPGWNPGLHFVAYDGPADGWLWIHIMAELAFGPYALLTADHEAGCLDRRVRQAQVPTLAADDAFWELLLHCLLDKGHVASRHAFRLQELVQEARADGPLAQLIANIAPPDCDPDYILNCVTAGDWAALEALGRPLANAWKSRLHVGRATLLARRCMLIVAGLRHLRRRRGLSVAVLGPDGAGKSTLIGGLEAAFILPAQSIYMGLTGGMLPHVDRLRLPMLVLPGRALVFWVRYLRALYHQARGRLVLFDRYTYDAHVPTPRPLSRLRRFYRWLDGHLCPAPDLVLLLDAPGAVMFARKGEYTDEMLEDWRQHFLALRGKVRQLEVVDATRSQEAVLTDALGRVWARYAARWGEAR